MPLSAGTRLGPYEIQSAIGAGGMGITEHLSTDPLQRTFGRADARVRRWRRDPARNGNCRIEDKT